VRQGPLMSASAVALWNVSPNGELRQAEEVTPCGRCPVDRLTP
jgi:hypothetical protein